MARPDILILGGGFAGVESALMLRRTLGDKAKVTLVSDRGNFVFKPNIIYVPFGCEPQRFQIPLSRIMGENDGLVRARVIGVDPDNKRVDVDSGARRQLYYNYLIIATGARMYPEEVPGLAKYAKRIWTPEDMFDLRGEFQSLLEGRRRTVLFVLASNNRCSGPLYEISFLLDTWLRRRGVRDNVKINFTTYEQGFLQAFGPGPHDMISQEFYRRGIGAHVQCDPKTVGKGEVIFKTLVKMPFDILVTLPPYRASMDFDLPRNRHGFIMTNPLTMQVYDNPNIYAIGDVSNLLSIKQGFLALMQAGVAARHLACKILGEEFVPTAYLESMCIMDKGGTGATFINVRKIDVTKGPENIEWPSGDDYVMSSSRLWQICKKMMWVCLSTAFRHGTPFHYGTHWRIIELMCRSMVSVLKIKEMKTVGGNRKEQKVTRKCLCQIDGVNELNAQSNSGTVLGILFLALLALMVLCLFAKGFGLF